MFGINRAFTVDRISSCWGSCAIGWHPDPGFRPGLSKLAALRQTHAAQAADLHHLRPTAWVTDRNVAAPGAAQRGAIRPRPLLRAAASACGPKGRPSAAQAAGLGTGSPTKFVPSPNG